MAEEASAGFAGCRGRRVEELNEQIKEFGTLTELLEDLEREGITGYQKKYLIDQFMVMQARIKKKPYTASFELTPLCNFDCKMCYVHLKPEQLSDSQRILSTEEWLKIMRQAVDMGVMHVDLTGGECLLHPGFKQLYSFLVSQGVNVAVLTNGQLITDDLIDFFRCYPPTAIQITLYGSNAEAYKMVTGRDAFMDVVNAISKLKAAGQNVRLVITPNRFMQKNTRELLEFIRQFGVKYDIGTAMLPPRPETGRKYDQVLMDMERYSEMMLLENEFRNLNENAQRSTKQYRFRVCGMESIQGLPCSAGTAAFHVNWKGEMTPCIPFHTISHTVLNGQLVQAWEWIGRKVDEYRTPEKCLSCQLVDVCKTCSAEKTSCMLNGEVNEFVCERLRKMIEVGLVKLMGENCD